MFEGTRLTGALCFGFSASNFEFKKTVILKSCVESDKYRVNTASMQHRGVSAGRPELVGGGLVRSLGGWTAVKALRGKGDRIKSDERILGGR